MAKPRGRPFPKGTRPPKGGRPKGVPNKVTIEVRTAMAEIVDNPTYRANLAKRAKAGKLAPPIETMLWHYAKGKPPDRVEVGAPGAFTRSMSDEELREELARLVANAQGFLGHEG